MKVELTDSDLNILSVAIMDRIEDVHKGLTEIKRRELMPDNQKEIMLKLDRRFFSNKVWKSYLLKRKRMLTRLVKKFVRDDEPHFKFAMQMLNSIEEVE